jgi:hypothetical protein
MKEKTPAISRGELRESSISQFQNLNSKL